MTSKSELGLVQMDDQWRFVGGRWEQDQEGLIIPPANLADENLAFKLRRRTRKRRCILGLAFKRQRANMDRRRAMG